MKFTEEQLIMRTRAGHNNQAMLVTTDPESCSAYGVKRQSILNGSKFFHVVDGLPSDIMHDLLEGVLPRHMKIMLKKFICEKKFFILEELNHRLSCFPYGSSDSTNKPSSINNLNTADSHLKQSGIVIFLFFFKFLNVGNVQYTNLQPVCLSNC